MTVIILAAGLSSRMGENKLLLPFRGEAILLHTIRRAKTFSDRIIVVTGNEREKIESLIKGKGVDSAFNPDYEKGQRGSTLRGIREVKDDDFAVLPGDLPLLETEDCIKAIAALASSPTSRCSHKGIPGHPVFYRKENRERLLAYPGTMKEYLKEFGCASVEASLGAVCDVDTPEKYHSLLEADGNLSVLE